MKNKKLFTVLFVLGLLVLVAGLMVLSNQDNSLTVEKPGDVSDTNNTVEEINKNEEESFFGSMQDLLTRGNSVKCTYNVVDGEGEAIGVLYIADNKVRSEMDIVEKETGKKMEVDSIITEDWMYTWNSFMPQGTKMNIKEMQGEANEDYSQDEADKMREETDYKCRPWIPDNSKFVVPTDIEFRDMTEMMQGFDMGEIEENVEKASAKLCEMCEMLTGEARDICRADAGCE